MYTTNFPLIYGTAWKKEQTKELVIQAVKAGFRSIDTACQPKHYNESAVGEALISLTKEGFKREDFFIQTKFTLVEGHDPLRMPYDKKAELSVQVAQSFELSKKNLQTSYVDSLVLHSPPSDFNDLEVAWSAMENIYKKKEAKELGISNIYDVNILECLYESAEIKPTIVQNRFHKQNKYDKEIRSFCMQNNISYQSFWTLTANVELLKNEELFNLAGKYQKNVIQIFFAYLNQIGITPLTGTKNIEHMKSDLDSFDIILEDNEVAKLNLLLEQA